MAREAGEHWEVRTLVLLVCELGSKAHSDCCQHVWAVFCFESAKSDEPWMVGVSPSRACSHYVSPDVKESAGSVGL